MISDTDEQMGWTFAVAQILFLLGFVGYFVVAALALVLDADNTDANEDMCAEQAHIVKNPLHGDFM